MKIRSKISKPSLRSDQDNFFSQSRIESQNIKTFFFVLDDCVRCGFLTLIFDRFFRFFIDEGAPPIPLICL